MLRNQRPARKAAIRPAVHRAGPDMALASTIVFFGMFPAVMGAGLLMEQFITAFAR